jgi:DtxR family Mn-dependent transcriptional regulator
MKLINYAPYQYITLTKKGEKLANELASLLRIFRGFFEDVLLVPEKIAERNSDVVFRIMDNIIFQRLKDFIQHQNTCLGCSDLKITWTADNKVVCPMKKHSNN